VIEAPLSVCFDSKGNPKGRSIEKKDGKTRYWYCGLGCAVMVAAMHLIRDIHEAGCAARLFEGFVSFKDGSVGSNHMDDVRFLREVVREPERFAQNIYSAEQLKLDQSDTLQSAFVVAGIDCGVPAVIVR
jgi:myosin-crossreactive antigen